MHWTPEHDAVLRTMRVDGCSFALIANTLACGFTRNACIGRASRIGLPVREHPLASLIEGPAKNKSIRNPNLAKRLGRQPRQLPARRPEPAAKREFLGIPLQDLEKGMCRFPRGDGPFLFCGQPTMGDSSYCAHCYKITHNGFGHHQPNRKYARRGCTTANPRSPIFHSEDAGQ